MGVTIPMETVTIGIIALYALPFSGALGALLMSSTCAFFSSSMGAKLPYLDDVILAFSKTKEGEYVRTDSAV